MLKTLIADIETSPIVALVWQIGQQYINPDQMIEDWHIMAFSAKWLGESPNKLIYMETREGNDYLLLKRLWSLFDEADVVVTQNGKKFDEPKIKARMMIHGFKPYKPFKHYDTYLQNKDKEFTSHSLAYLTDKFCTKYKKLKHKNFPGLSLWKECRKGNPKAWAEMRKYNNYDTLSTEELYMNTKAWSTKSAPGLFEGSTERLCKSCGKYECIKQTKKFDRTARKKFHWMQCQSCGKYQRGPEVSE